MKWTGLNELRESYLSFFESKEHLRLPSFPLVPQDDNSILLINAGMTPLKKYFQGVEEPPKRRITTCQKCIRTPDIENVGKTARHGTYFEMLGNFSFGDYFKKEAIAWAWEYFTKVLEMPPELLYVSVYEQDNEAESIWLNDIGLSADHIVRMGKKDNFWEHGSGPCGPCSEIYFDRGVDKGCKNPDCKVGCECDRFVEVWNLVFTQFDNDGKGNYTPLASKNIDTGMGLERLACVMQGVDNLFEVDTIQNIMTKICEITGKTYKQNDKEDVSIRVITDHIRSTTFMVSDGVRPSNEGRGYVLRRLLRRAARHGRLLGVNRPFLFEVCDTVINENISAYPELAENREYVKKVIKTEEEAFAKTVENGIQILQGFIDKMPAGSVLSGEDVFKLHDTYGFPLDLTREILEEREISIDEARFHELMKIQRETARSNRSFKGGWDDTTTSALTGIATEFVGYTDLQTQTKILALIHNNESVESVAEGDEVSVLLEKTPFYAESGGQIGDKGTIVSGDNIIEITDTVKASTGQFISIGHVVSGSFYVHDVVTACVDKQLRQATMRNHTATHMLQAALRKVLGDHVHQAGSLVDPYKLRFDFSHFSAVTPEEIAEIERIVNEKILEGIPVVTEVLPIEEARKKGAIALFGEKYGDVVRIVTVDGFSVEFCGGTHIDNTAKAGLLKIVSESSVAAGVRRIEAVTGLGVLTELEKATDLIHSVCATLKVPNSNLLLKRTETVMQELSDKTKEIEKLNSQISSTQLKSLTQNAKEVKGIQLFTATLDGTTGEALRKAGDDIKSKQTSFIALLAGIDGDKGNLLCVCSADAVKLGAHAGQIVRKAAELTGGKGGGKPDSAMAGIGNLKLLQTALDSFEQIVSEFLK